MKKRENYKVIIDPIAEERIKKNQCPACGLPKDKWTRRKDWRCCSNKCTNIFWKQYTILGWPDLRQKAINRDGNKCVKCGSPGNEKRIHKGRRFSFGNPFGYIKETKEEFKKRIRNNYEVIEFKYEKNKFVAWINSPGAFIGDHIEPIALGGDEWDINNVQTLCNRCNQKKTSQDIKKIAIQRRIEKLSKEQKRLI